MNNYGTCSAYYFFVFSGANMSSNITKLSINGFLTQWAFHRVQEHPNRSLDGEFMTFRSWRSYVGNLDELTELTS